MTKEMILANAKLVLRDEVIVGAVVVRDGRIAQVDSGANVPAGAVDCEGDFLSPGLIELHTDNLERHMKPRPNVDWPHRAAIVGHDRELAGTGITTVFDAIRVGSIHSHARKRYNRYARGMADEILEMRDRGALKISHHIHLRAEVCSETLVEELEEFGPGDRVGILSLMDHTPGQRQFRDLAKFEDYVCTKNNMPREGFAEYCDFLRGLQRTYGVANEAAAVSAAARYGAVLASHDDTTAEQVAQSHAHGISLAEFPTTVEAATACTQSGIATMIGAPNLVRGGSHSGNVAASELAQMDMLDILSSDYVPAALLMGALLLGDLWGDMARGIATVTAAPARHARLADRGTLAVGQRADLIRFGRIGRAPLVHGVWVMGGQVA
ncbi:alpha-D-ribose 1-methylphosphonate 5-triphosphate diphosphatase [Sulfitobacter sp. JB4-11]|uniref:alpha-D-ribose 1-methylphosphonate 5-triphosphate diphosphatase n=1 Tax=Sulfitobacter rhodophyticola TaxID=3238304 RepID=UPI00351313CC